MTPCSLKENERFGRTFCLSLQVRWNFDFTRNYSVTWSTTPTSWLCIYEHMCVLKFTENCWRIIIIVWI